MQFVKKCFYSLLGASVLFASNVFAQAGKLPTMEDPSRGAGSGLRETAQNHIYDWGILAGLVIATIGFIVVSYNAIQVFAEVQAGKKKWADFGLVVIVGVLMLIAVIWLLTKASEIL
jgi:integrating conjugative element membrane protein (TIGR03745 family)